MPKKILDVAGNQEGQLVKSKLMFRPERDAPIRGWRKGNRLRPTTEKLLKHTMGSDVISKAQFYNEPCRNAGKVVMTNVSLDILMGSLGYRGF